MTWGDYVKSSETRTGKDGKERTHAAYARQQMKETINVNFREFERGKEYQLPCDSNVVVHVSRIPLKQGYSLVTSYVMNKRRSPESDIESLMFQVGLRAYAADGSARFIAEHICRKVPAIDEVYFEQRPIFGRGRGCAATWGAAVEGHTTFVASDHIPQYEFPSVSAALEGFDKLHFSMRFMSKATSKGVIIERLRELADTYERWINEKLVASRKMQDVTFREKIGNQVI